jgi:hypothetical protein
MDTKATLGKPVIFTDPKGNDHDALTTAVWGDTCCNLVYVLDDPSSRDNYGRQTKHETSVTHASVNKVHGNCYRLVGQPKPEYRAPASV